MKIAGTFLQPAHGGGRICISQNLRSSLILSMYGLDLFYRYIYQRFKKKYVLYLKNSVFNITLSVTTPQV